MLGRVKKLVNLIRDEKRSPRQFSVKDWERVYESPLPKVGALIGLSSSGSHYVLHQLHGHPMILSLKEGELFRDLKAYFRTGDYSIDHILSRQLRPKKQTGKKIRWIFTNKPTLGHIAHEFLHNRDKVRQIFCFRNPVATVFSKFVNNARVAEQYYQKKIDIMDTTEWMGTSLSLSLAGFAQTYDPRIDMVVNLESMICNTDTIRDMIIRKLDLPVIPKDQLFRLEFCEECGERLEVRRSKIGKHNRLQEVLYCVNCEKIYTGPGGYNYIREVTPRELKSWKAKPNADEIYGYFSDLFGNEVMRFFDEEIYLGNDSHLKFEEIFKVLMYKYKV